MVSSKLKVDSTSNCRLCMFSLLAFPEFGAHLLVNFRQDKEQELMSIGTKLGASWNWSVGDHGTTHILHGISHLQNSIC